MCQELFPIEHRNVISSVWRSSRSLALPHYLGSHANVKAGALATNRMNKEKGLPPDKCACHVMAHDPIPKFKRGYTNGCVLSLLKPPLYILSSSLLWVVKNTN